VFDRLAVRERRVVLCHNDLNSSNVVDDGIGLWLVDWEYGGRGDALLDIAGFLTLHHAGIAATEAFLEGYGGLAPGELERLGEARWAFDYVQWLWYRGLEGPRQPAARRRARRLALRLRRCDN
jgi:aminoglycoside phosphotransferase (APT) family kinase protein